MSLQNSSSVGLFGNYAREIEKHWKHKEKERREYFFTSPQLPFRSHLVEWLKNVCEKMKVSYRTIHLAIYILDMFMDRHSIEKDRLGFVALVCLMLAAKFEEYDSKVPNIPELNKFDGFRYSNKDFIKVEIMVLKFLDFGLTQPTIAHFAEYYARFIIIPSDLDNAKASLRNLGDICYSIMAEFLDICLKEVKLVQYPPSQVAAACALATRRRMGLSPSWTPVLSEVTGYGKENLDQCVTLLLKKMQLENSQKMKTVESPDHGYISDTP